MYNHSIRRGKSFGLLFKKLAFKTDLLVKSSALKCTYPSSILWFLRPAFGDTSTILRIFQTFLHRTVIELGYGRL